MDVQLGRGPREGWSLHVRGLTRGQTAVAAVLSSHLSVLSLRLPGGMSSSGSSPSLPWSEGAAG